MGKFSQTEEAKSKYASELFNYMKMTAAVDKNYIFTKEELAEKLEVSPREVRRQLAKLANYYPLIATSDKKGYRIGHFDDDSSLQELSQLYDDACHTIAELQSRVSELQARMKPLIALKVEVSRALYDRGVRDAFDELFETEE